MAVDPIPSDYPRMSPYLCVDGAATAIDWYGSVLGATERMRIAAPDGKIGHAELSIGESLLMLADEFPEMGNVGPKTIGGCPIVIGVYVEDVDATFDLALASGATSLRPVANQFYGDRVGMFQDPFGYRWSVSSHIEDVSPDEMLRRSDAMMSGDVG